MSVKSKLDRAARAGEKMLEKKEQNLQTIAKIWLEALVEKAAEDPLEFVSQGVFVPPWLLFVGEEESFARMFKEEICAAMDLPEGYRVEAAGSSITLSKDPEEK